MILAEPLCVLINHLPLPASIRAVNTGQYLIANQQHAIQHGFTSSSELLGITHKEVCYHHHKKLADLEGSLILEERHNRLIEALDAQAARSNRPLSVEICTLFPTGFIYKGVLTQVPILNHYNQVGNILTLFEDKTDKVDLCLLYKLYKKHYPAQKAIIQFIKYLDIEKYFKKPPTNQELITLLAMRNRAVSKYVAKLLNINYRTVEEYKARLRNKLEPGTLSSLLVLLRSSQRNTVQDKLPLHYLTS